MKSSAALVLLMAALSAIPSAAMPLGLRLSAQAAAKSKPAKDPLLMTEAEAYACYAPDTAFVIDLSKISTTSFTLTNVGCSGRTGQGSSITIEWGDGTSTTTGRSTYGSTVTHTYPEIGQYVVRARNVKLFFDIHSNSRAAAVRPLRWADDCILQVGYGGDAGLYQYCANLTALADGKLPRWPSKIDAQGIGAPYRGCTSLTVSELPKWPTSCPYVGAAYQYCKGITLTGIPDWPANCASIGATYQGCTSLAATSFPEWPANCTYIGATYQDCTSLAATSFPEWPAALTYIEGDVYANCTAVKTDKIPKWPLGLTRIGNYGVYQGCKGLTATDIPDWPTNCCKSTGKLGGIYANTGIKPTRLPNWPTGENVKTIDNVYQGCDLSGVTSLPDWPTTLQQANSTYYGANLGALAKLPDWPTTLTSADSTYQNANLSAVTSLPAWSNCTALVNVSWCYWNSKLAVSEIPAWPTSLQYADYTYGYNTSLSVPSLPAWSNCTALTSCSWTFRDCPNIAAEVPALPPNVQNAEGVFYNCQKLTGEIKPWPSSVVNATYTYGQCLALTGNIPAWSEKITSAANTYVNCRALTGAWTSDPAELMPTNITSHGSCVSGASDDLRKLFYQSWGGDLPDPAN